MQWSCVLAEPSGKVVGFAGLVEVVDVVAEQVAAQITLKGCGHLFTQCVCVCVCVCVCSVVMYVVLSPCTNKGITKFLSSLPQVLQLLDCMGLAAYKGKFSEEQVSGEILAECDEQVLQNDLGIGSKLHRMRLLKVISGMCTCGWCFIWVVLTLISVPCNYI